MSDCPYWPHKECDKDDYCENCWMYIEELCPGCEQNLSENVHKGTETGDPAGKEPTGEEMAEGIAGNKTGGVSCQCRQRC
jgi:predicted amidophosphoribosyltransferase